jgi:hypothetical protein
MGRPLTRPVSQKIIGEEKEKKPAAGLPKEISD